jgi:hypothetical protein
VLHNINSVIGHNLPAAENEIREMEAFISGGEAGMIGKTVGELSEPAIIGQCVFRQYEDVKR